MKTTRQRTSLFYDAFRDYVESSEWIPYSVPRGSESYTRTLQAALRPLVQSQIRVLTADVLQLALDMSTKAGTTPVPYLPYPKYPLWIEFGEDRIIGDTEIQFKAIWLFLALDRVNTLQCNLITLTGQAKSLFISLDTGSWSFEQMGACTLACPRGTSTAEGVAYHIDSSEAKNLMASDCVCAEAGWQWAQLVFLIGHLLRLPRTVLKETSNSRDLPLPRGFNARQIVEAENKKYPRYMHLSLTHPLEVHRRTPRTPSSSTQTPTEQQYIEMQQVAGSWRTLIPGEGKPWKELQIFYVDSYARETHGDATQPVRYIIEP